MKKLIKRNILNPRHDLSASVYAKNIYSDESNIKQDSSNNQSIKSFKHKKSPKKRKMKMENMDIDVSFEDYYQKPDLFKRAFMRKQQKVFLCDKTITN